MTIAEKLVTIAENEQKVYAAGYEKGKAEGGGGGGITPSGEIEITENGTHDVTQYASAKVNVASSGGEQPTLFAPSIALTEGYTISITEGANGAFLVKYAIYVNDVFIVETDDKTVDLSQYASLENGDRIVAKTVASNFNDSAASNIILFTSSEGTFGLAYSLQSDGTYRLTGRGSAEDIDIVIPSIYQGVAVTGIADGAFSGDKTIASLTVAEGVVSAGDRAFYNCPNITKISLPASLVTAGTYAFRNSTYTEAIIPAKYMYNNNVGLSAGNIVTLTIICGEVSTAMNASSKLSTVKILKDVTTIAGGAFEYGSKLKTVDLTDYGSLPFPQLSGANAFPKNSGFQILIPSGRKTELSGMTNWSSYKSYMVEV